MCDISNNHIVQEMLIKTNRTIFLNYAQPIKGIIKKKKSLRKKKKFQQENLQKS